MENNGNRILKNSAIAILYEVIAVIAGLILPRLIIVNFGSNYNGIVSSVTQFLSFVVLIRSGIGGVAKVHLYKSIRENDKKTTSMVMHATRDYMNKVSLVFLIGLISLAIVYPFVVSLDWLSTALLVLICGLSSLAENYFGISSMILLQADRREYIISMGDIVVTLFNTLFTVVLIRLGVGVHGVKLGSAIAFCIKPFFLFFYVKKKYDLEKDVAYPKSLLSQKKDAFVHVMAEFIHRNTAVIVLTVFVNTLVVSVYTVYSIVINGMRKLTAACTANIESVLGRLYANKDKTGFLGLFQTFEYCSFLLANFIYICCACLLSSFIHVYTAGVTDTEYIIPLFALLLCVGEFFDLIKTPYQFAIRVAGHFKQTKWISVVETVINVCLSLSLVHRYQLIGIAIGNAVAMMWRTVAYAIYVKKKVTTELRFHFVNYLLLSMGAAVLSASLYHWIDGSMATSYLQWVGQAFLAVFTTFGSMLVLNLIFCRAKLFAIVKELRQFVKKRRT